MHGFSVIGMILIVIPYPEFLAFQPELDSGQCLGSPALHHS